jgi:hypothetical protein
VEELEDRLRRLHAGEPITEEDVLHAELAARRAGERSAEAHRRARAAYKRAAQSHRTTAQALEASHHPDEAARHRRLADADDASADDHARVIRPVE